MFLHEYSRGGQLLPRSLSERDFTPVLAAEAPFRNGLHRVTRGTPVHRANQLVNARRGPVADEMFSKANAHTPPFQPFSNHNVRLLEG